MSFTGRLVSSRAPHRHTEPDHPYRKTNGFLLKPVVALPPPPPSPSVSSVWFTTRVFVIAQIFFFFYHQEHNYTHAQKNEKKKNSNRPNMFLLGWKEPIRGTMPWPELF